MIGKTISHYEVLEKLGEGGMGLVYKALDSRLDRFVALKILPADKVSDPQRKLRFVQEAKAASSLNHPNIVTIHDIGNSDGVDFIAMEYITGKTLDHLIGGNGLPPSARTLASRACGHSRSRPTANLRARPSRPSTITPRRPCFRPSSTSE